MKPRTIATLEGIFTLDGNGFYVPADPPETRYAWRFKAWWLVAVIGGAAIAACLVEAVRALPV